MDVIKSFDVVVIGAGIQGSATAYQLAKKGCHTLLLEQFPLGHSRGSSHGYSRILRSAYPEKNSYYAAMVKDAVTLWRNLEAEEGTSILNATGVLTYGRNSQILKDFETAVIKSQVKYHKLTNPELRKKFPMIKVPTESEALLEPDCGMVIANKALRAFQNQFVKRGGLIQDHETVTNIVPGRTVKIQTSGGHYECRAVVITAGPWTSTLLRPMGLDLPLQPLLCKAMYWKVTHDGLFSAKNCPVIRFPKWEKDLHNIYGLPSEEYPGLLKLCYHYGEAADPGMRDAMTHGTADVEAVSRFITKHLPDVEPRPSIIEPCFYTMTPDAEFILDSPSKWPNIVIGAGFSGHGFKFAPVVGDILSDLAMSRKPAYDMNPFRLDRFNSRHAKIKSSI